jgi:hypothetical protein
MGDRRAILCLSSRSLSQVGLLESTLEVPPGLRPCVGCLIPEFRITWFENEAANDVQPPRVFISAESMAYIARNQMLDFMQLAQLL